MGDRIAGSGVEMKIGAAGLAVGAGTMLSAKPMFNARYFDEGVAEREVNARQMSADARRAYMLHDVSPAERAVFEGLEASYDADVRAVESLGPKAHNRLALGSAIFLLAAAPFVDGWTGGSLLGAITGTHGSAKH
jgi:hypothetical protein